MKKPIDTATRALKIHLGKQLREANVRTPEEARAYVHKWLDFVERSNVDLDIKFLASEIRKVADDEIDYNELWKV